MHHYCMIIAKTAEARCQIALRLERFVEDRLTFEPDEVVLHSIGCSTFVFSVSTGQRQVGVESPVHLGSGEACLAGGLPTFERFPQYEPSSHMPSAAWTSELLQTRDPSELFVELGGNYSVVRATSEEVTAFASFAGYDSLFYLDNDLYVVVGSRPALVAAFQSSGPYSGINLCALSWVLSTTMILGTDTPWREVTRLPTDEMLTIRGQRANATPMRTTVPTDVDATNLSASYDSAVRRLTDRFEWYLRTGMPLTAHLTGGKDSRMILALLSATGSIDRVGEIVTNGSEESGDVIVARQIAAALGLENHIVREGAKAAVHVADWHEHQRRFRFSPWKYDMYLTPYDGWGESMSTPWPTTMLTGGGGEILRQKGIAPDARTESQLAVVDRFINWYYRHDALELLDAEVANWQRAWIHDEVKGMIDAGVVNLQQRFYIEQRMANWGNAHLRNNGASSLAALVDLDLARIMHAEADMSDEVPYEVLTRCAPHLREISFANDTWLGRTMARAEADGTFRPPIAAAVSKSFPWQFALYRDHRDELLRECLSSISAWAGIVPAKQIERLLSQPVEPFNSSHVKMLFGLVAGTSYLTGTLAPARDFASTTAPLTLRGNEAGTARPWFDHRPTQCQAM